jgi:hypothetical protein
VAEATVWINTTDYTPLELALFALGCLGWVVVYLIVAKNIIRHHFVEIPWAAVAANVAWEFVWSFVYETNMGRLFGLGYEIWFFLDVFIVYGVYRYGTNQLSNPKSLPFLRPALVFGIVAWTVLLYFLRKEGYDTITGAISGYILNVMMSALYIVHFLGRGDKEPFSYVAAWSKFFGTGLISVFCFLYWPDKWFLLSMCVIAAVLDVAYIVLFTRSRTGRGV